MSDRSLRSVRSTHLTVVGAAGAALLTVTALAAPALAANSAAHVDYTCSAPTPLPPATPSADYSVAAAPATMSVGQPLVTTVQFTLDSGTTSAAQGLGWVKFKGTVTTAPSPTQAGLSLSFPKTTLGTGAGGSTTATATGSTLAGSALSNSFAFVLGNLGRVVLTGYKADGTKSGTVVFPSSSFGRCNNLATTTSLMDGLTPVTAKLVADKTHTADKAKYAAKRKTATGTATVTSRYGFIVPTGKVTLILKRGTKTIASAKVSLNKKGVAKHVFKGVKRKGTYSITGKYAGTKTMKASTGKPATFKVG